VNAQKIINSRYTLQTVLWVGRVLPPRVGYAFADGLAGWLSRQSDLAPVKAVRANQWVISGYSASGEALDRLVRETLRSAAHCVYDFYHTLNDPAGLSALVEITPSFEALLQRTFRQEQGTILALPHIANTDLVGRALALRGMRFQAITPANPNSGYQLQNQLRREVGFTVTPASMEAVRMATERLRSGGTIVSGVDRPLEESKYPVHFFGLPAFLPLPHVRLALKLDLPVFVVGVGQPAGGRYRLWVSDPVFMRRFSDPAEEIVQNAEMVLKIIEENIHQFPTQWNMTYPVWPQIIGKVD
jgi:lauroyl/myristoyl acyltransferase